jgi:hypothetical protein
MGVAIKEDGQTVGFFSPKKVQCYDFGNIFAAKNWRKNGNLDFELQPFKHKYILLFLTSRSQFSQLVQLVFRYGSNSTPFFYFLIKIGNLLTENWSKSQKIMIKSSIRVMAYFSEKCFFCGILRCRHHATFLHRLRTLST